MADQAMLEGITVLDFGRLLPSGVATYQLAALGATVVKVERPPLGDHLRVNPPLIGGRGDMHLDINRNKLSLALDFATESGRRVAHRLIRSADVVVESSRPGALAKYGLGYSDVRQIRPGIVYCSFTGYGQAGPYAHMPAHGLSADAAGGMLIPAPGDPSAAPRGYTSAGAWAAGMHGAVALTAALVRRHPDGCHLDISQSDAAAAFNFRHVDLAGNRHDSAEGSFEKIGPRYAAYRCQDGRYVLLTVTERRLWNDFCDAVGRPDLRSDSGPDLLPYENDPTLAAELTRIFTSRPQPDWMALAAERRLGIAPVHDPRDLAEDPHFTERRTIEEMPHPVSGRVRLVTHPVAVSGVKAVLRPAPELGEHSRAVLSEAGFSAAEIDALIADGVVT
ncbi:MAG TPA: CaiB/BaiF CoA-transferase family protein [Streptosporangiaceae bacterium]|nr:CaiB/BaiF CoA-transferase family protein [Streptosporangiaceae bacterium]